MKRGSLTFLHFLSIIVFTIKISFPSAMVKKVLKKKKKKKNSNNKTIFSLYYYDIKKSTMKSSYALAEPSPPISCPTKIPWYPPPPSWVKVNVDVARSSSKASARLNLFNHVLALFHAKFTCNLAIRNPIFSWELCKCCV